MIFNRTKNNQEKQDLEEVKTSSFSTAKKIWASILLVLSTLFPADWKWPIKPIKKWEKIVKTEIKGTPLKPKNWLDRITIHPQEDIELQRYRSYKTSADLAIKKKNQLIKKFPQLLKDIDPIESRQMFTLAVKESRLDFAKPNKSWAFWYSWLKPIAIAHVDNILKKHGIQLWSKKKNKSTRTYDPTKNHADHILYMHLYFWSQQKELLNLVPQLPKKDRFWFTVAWYNAWISRIAELLRATKYPSSRNQFVEKWNKNLMKLSSKPKAITEKSYGTSNYKDRFNGKDYSKNKKVIVDWRFSTTMWKWYEIIRYVEMNRAIKESIK